MKSAVLLVMKMRKLVVSMHYNSLFKTSLCYWMCFQVVDAMYIFPCTSKFSSDAILIFSNSSLMQSRYKVDTFHAVFALEILAPCISVFSMHNELQLHAFQYIHIEFQFHAFQCMHIEFQFHAFQCMNNQRTTSPL